MVNTTDQFHAKDNVVTVHIVKHIVCGSTDGCLERKTMISEDNIGVRWVSDSNNIMDNHQGGTGNAKIAWGRQIF